MDPLFEKTSFACSKLITENYSTSFALGIKTLHKKFHDPIYGIYGFVRFADEIVDTFHDFNRADLLAEFKADTFKAIESGISLNPVLHSFQHVVNAYNIDHELINSFLYSMEMDLADVEYDEETYKRYIFGSAEAVGLMCLHIFVNGEKNAYEKLKDDACSLGAAFQKVNFLRDIKSDFEDRGRVYFPGVDFSRFTKESKKNIEADIQIDFDNALRGIMGLPKGARSGVYLAYVYYLQLFNRIKSTDADTIKEKRIRVPDFVKFTLLAKTIFKERTGAM